MLITTSADQTAKIWNTPDFSLLQELKQENQRWVWDAAFSADGQYVFTGQLAVFIHFRNFYNQSFLQPHLTGLQNYGT